MKYETFLFLLISTVVVVCLIWGFKGFAWLMGAASLICMFGGGGGGARGSDRGGFDGM